MKYRKFKFFFLFFVVLNFLPVFSIAAEKTSTLADQESVAITIYNTDLGLVKDSRNLQLLKGSVELKFMDVASGINPTSVHFKSLSFPNLVNILEQNYEYDLMSPEKLMEKYVGKDVELHLINPETFEDKTTKATLLSTNQGYIYKIGEQISLNPPGQVVLPQIPENLISQPTLVWLLDNKTDQPQKVEVSYLTSGINWKTDYVVLINEQDTKLDLTGWVTIDNKSGATYKNASLKLIAGDVHRVQPPLLRSGAMYKTEALAAEAPAPQFAEKSFFEYHIYTLQRKTTIKDNQTKQMTLLSAPDVPTKKIFFYLGKQDYFFDYWRGQTIKGDKVKVMLEVENKKDNNLGMPLPKGIVRVYKKDDDGSLQFIGEDSIDHTPKDEKFKIQLGEAFDVVVERSQTDFERISDSPFVFEVSFKITIRNHKSQDIVVKVEEHLPGDWKILASSLKYNKKDSSTIEFDVPVKKDGETELTYKARVKY